MLKYLIFLIIGIILYILLNSVDSFNIGNQYELTSPPPDVGGVLLQQLHPLPPGIDAPPIGDAGGDAGGGSRPQTLVEIFTDVYQRVNVCSDRGLACCVDIIRSSGLGACQTYTIAALFRVLGLNLDETDIDFLKSFGPNLGNQTNFHDAIGCLFNTIGEVDGGFGPSREVLEILLRNGIKPNIQEIVENISDFLLNRIYPIYIATLYREAVGILNAIEIRDLDDRVETQVRAHNLLLYKTNYLGFKSFVEQILLEQASLEEHELNPTDMKIQQLQRKLSILERFNSANPNDPIIIDGIVCICIDHLNGLFYALTEVDNPVTSPPNPQDSSEMDEYNKDWRNKIVYGYYALRYRKVKINDGSPNTYVNIVGDPFDSPPPYHSIDSRMGNLNFYFTESEDFARLSNVSLFKGMSFEIDDTSDLTTDAGGSEPPTINFGGVGDTVSRQEICYGKKDRKCRSDIPQCDEGLSCVNPELAQHIPNIDTRGPICMEEDTEGTECNRVIGEACDVNASLYCLEYGDSKYCIKAGRQGQPCRDNTPGNPYACEHGLECIENICVLNDVCAALLAGGDLV
jgi:hypothetical protein